MPTPVALEEGRNLIAAADGETNKERLEHVRHLQKEAFQLANYYFVFQSVIFTAFYNSPSHIKCRYHWIPFTLSFLAGFLNLCALSTIAFNYKRTLDEIDKHATTRNSGGNPTAAERSGNNEEAIAIKCARCWRMLYVIGCMALFIGFFSVTLIGCWTITCVDSPVKAMPPV